MNSHVFIIKVIIQINHTYLRIPRGFAENEVCGTDNIGPSYTDAFSNRSTLDCIFKCLRFHDRFRVNRKCGRNDIVTFSNETLPCNWDLRLTT